MIDDKALLQQCELLLGKDGKTAYGLRHWAAGEHIMERKERLYLDKISAVQLCAVYCLLNGRLCTSSPLYTIDGIDINFNTDKDRWFDPISTPEKCIEVIRFFRQVFNPSEHSLLIKEIIPYIPNIPIKKEKRKSFKSLFYDSAKERNVLFNYTEIYWELLLNLYLRMESTLKYKKMIEEDFKRWQSLQEPQPQNRRRRKKKQ